jgi:hypothetical protein
LVARRHLRTAPHGGHRHAKDTCGLELRDQVGWQPAQRSDFIGALGNFRRELACAGENRP